MEGELALFQAQVNEYKYEVDHLITETTEVKKKYFTMKKKEMVIKEQQAKLEGRDKIVIQRHPPTQRFTGGGFNLAI
jgi:hypothetical protein